ncbi:MAG TPA: type II secretion system protein [bacterium]|nr:type II secretion system protein [bacterium]
MKKKSSFSIVEVLVSLAIFTMIMSLVFSLTSVGRLSWANFSAHLRVQQTARTVLGQIASELSLSSTSRQRLLVDQYGKVVLFRKPFLAINDVDDYSDDETVWGDGLSESGKDRYVAYSLVTEDGENYIVRELLDSGHNSISGTATKIASGVSEFTVDNLGGGRYLVAIKFSLSSYGGKALSSTLNYDISTLVYVRN